MCSQLRRMQALDRRLKMEAPFACFGERSNPMGSQMRLVFTRYSPYASLFEITEALQGVPFYPDDALFKPPSVSLTPTLSYPTVHHPSLQHAAPPNTLPQSQPQQPRPQIRAQIQTTPQPPLCSPLPNTFPQVPSSPRPDSGSSPALTRLLVPVL